MPKEDVMSAQMSMLKKMREEHKSENSSTLESILSNNRIKKSSLKPEIIEKVSSASTLIEIPTNQCKPWIFADRSEYEMGNIEDLANSIKLNGQQEPALIRKSKQPVEGMEYEVIFGHRRWLACKLCDKPLLAIVKDLTDKEAAIAQKEENENRENLSDFSRAKNYRKLLDEGVFNNESELSANLNIARSTLGDIMSFNKIPKKILAEIKNPHEITRRLAIKITQICKTASEEEIIKLTSIIPSIIEGKLPTHMLDNLNKDKATNKDNHNKPVKVFKNDLSVKLFKSSYNQNNSPTFTFHKIVSDNNLLEDLENIVFSYLKDRTEK